MPKAREVENGPWWTQMVIFWHENQAVMTFHSDLDYSAGASSIIRSLRLQDLNAFLNMRGYNLTSFTPQDLPSPSQEPSPPLPPPEEQEEPSSESPAKEVIEGIGDVAEGIGDVVKGLERELEKVIVEPFKGEHGNGKDGHDNNEDGDDNLNSPVGKYLFTSPTGHGTLVNAFFHVEPTPAYSMAGFDISLFRNMGRESTYRSGPAQAMSDYTGKTDTTVGVVNLINDNLITLRELGKIPINAAAPNWLGSGAHGCTTGGGPGDPPSPIPTQEMCDPASDCWRMSLSDIVNAPASPIRNLKGDNITVFVLDTIPNATDIQTASQNTGGNNLLLQDIAIQIQAGSIIINHQTLPGRLDDPNSDQPGSGRDVYGQLFNYDMRDHGLFVTGIIHDLVSNAQIECVRVLNDFGVGDVATLCDTLKQIHDRMLPGGNLYDNNLNLPKPVVINLSLLATPPDEILYDPQFGFDPTTINQLRTQLHDMIQSLVSLGAVFVAAAGNDSDMAANPPYRWNPRYPAAFPEVISVGAVDNTGSATTYSNYPVSPSNPAYNGIATYGGGLPAASPSTYTPNGIEPTVTVSDAVRGVFSSTNYPPLSADPALVPYPAPNQNAWAYWSGTSFATPIISAVAARVLQNVQTLNLAPNQWAAKVQWAITTTEGQGTMLIGNAAQALASSNFGLGVGLLQAQQTCQPLVAEPVATLSRSQITRSGEVTS